ncbi:hypothetical protein A4D02_26430 [Niastella koreensis]|uniref:DUF6968 domain-containing protein n=2 Tax=Niastella koreensis TaxID=354356 RepID=G8TJJ0_NIAKG|nr:hypothetical protein [Niastella koreensis]AEV99725.1 hypothetical protein Niako_3420 [Niastella koreensis GR20-10]OQP51650.1 hypothetical protein A4D02_26430 [Niastella koreensis]
MRTYIAERTLYLKNADEEVKEVNLGIGQPYYREEGNWACPIQLIGLFENLSDVPGEDSFQALMLAQNLARTLLNALVEKGWSVYCFEDKEVDVDTLFKVGI